MRRSSFSVCNFLVAAALSTLLLTRFSAPSQGQSAIQTQHGIGSGYDATHEITREGTIREVRTAHVAGSPAGLHLIVDSPTGLIDAHLGNLLSPRTKELLLPETPVKIVGAMTTCRGKNYLLTRLVTVGDQTIKVRGKSGIPEIDLSNMKWHPRNTQTEVPAPHETPTSESTGGAR